MSNEQESLINDLQKEFRGHIIQQLRDLQEGQKSLINLVSKHQDKMDSQIEKMRVEFALKTELAKIKEAQDEKDKLQDEKIEKLETFKNKAIGIILAASTIISLLLTLIEKGLFK